MAEFCKECSLEVLGNEEHDEPCFCENCGEEKPKKKRFFSFLCKIKPNN